MPLEISTRLELLERAAFYPKYQNQATSGHSSKRGSIHDVAYESKSVVEKAKNLLMQVYYTT